MRFKLFIILFCFLSFPSFSQQQPWYSQYILNNFIINPGLAGIENYWDARTSYRNQWTGIPGAPITLYASIQGPLRGDLIEDESPVTLHETNNPRGYSYWENYTSAPSHTGIGFTVINDRTGPLSNLSALATMAYHIKLSTKSALSLGVSAGVQEISLNSQNLYFGTANPTDPSVYTNGDLNKIKPAMNVGLWYYSSQYFLGLSAQQIIPQTLSFNGGLIQSNANSGKLIPNLFFQAGYKILLSENYSVLPSCTIRDISTLPLGFDINTKMQFRDIFWIGGTYRYNSGYALMVGFNTRLNINLGYSYDFTLSPLNSVAGGTHEIQIGYLIRNHLHDHCPRNLW